MTAFHALGPSPASHRAPAGLPLRPASAVPSNRPTRQGLTFEAAAVAVGMSKSSVYRICTGG